MAKRMLIDAAHPEETRVVVLNGNRLEEFDFETSTKRQIKGNIYLAKITRVEPSLQAAFVEYGGNRHGFLAFNEIHPDYYRIPVADRQAALAAERAAEAAADAREEREEHEGAHAEAEAADAAMSVPIIDTLDAADFAPVPDQPPERRAEDAVIEVIRSEPVLPQEPALDVSPESPEPAGFGLTGEAAAGEPVSPHDEPSPEALAELAPDASDAGPGEDGSAALAESAGGDARSEAAAAAPHHGDAIETVGGDEIEEATRPRVRPYRHYKIQEVIKRRQIMLVQVTKEERGNKGAALTTYLSLAGRYCVLMPNTPRGGGVSRKITNNIDRRRLKDLMSDLEVPEGMGVIVRTAGSERSKAEIKRDFEYLIRLWDEIRDLTLKSTAPALIYEEGNLIKRSIRDLYARDIEEVVVAGDEGYRTAKAFMKMLMPSHAKRVRLYSDPTVPLFPRFQVEGQLDAIHSPVVQLRSGGYTVINPTEALVAIDVNSGRSTRERNIEETALKTNIEAAEEIALQLRLRDLAGLIVIDFIDMEEHRNRSAVERRLKDAMRHDRARIQLGRISPFGLLELSRQRLRPSLIEASTQPCPYCNGTGHIRSIESTALHVLRAIEEEGTRRRSAEITVAVPPKVALYILNQKRTALQQAEQRYGFSVTIGNDETLVPPAFRLDRLRALTPDEIAALPTFAPPPAEPEEDDETDAIEAEPEAQAEADEPDAVPPGDGADDEPGPQPTSEDDAEARPPMPPRHENGEDGHGRRRHRRRRGRRGDGHDERPGGDRPIQQQPQPSPFPSSAEADEGAIELDAAASAMPAPPQAQQQEFGKPGERPRRRRGRRGGRRRHHDGQERGPEIVAAPDAPVAERAELIPPGPADESAVADIAASFAASPAPVTTLETASIPIAESTEPTAAPHPPDAEPEHDAPAERAAHYNVSPAREVTGPPEKPRRGWWRR